MSVTPTVFVDAMTWQLSDWLRPAVGPDVNERDVVPLRPRNTAWLCCGSLAALRLVFKEQGGSQATRKHLI